LPSCSYSSSLKQSVALILRCLGNAGIYSIDIEVESWDSDIDIDKLMELMKVEIL
jgi:hypothetical protein